MSSRASNALLKDGRDEAAILLNFWGNPLLNKTVQPQQAPTQLERWREMTDWVSQDEGMVLFGKEANHVDSTLAANPCLREVHEEIGQLSKLEANWSDEDAPAIDRACILHAQKFVQWLSCEAAEQALAQDCAPSIFPTISGGVKLYWKANGHQVSLTFEPGQNAIEAVEKIIGQPANRWRVSEEEAGVIALKAMRETV